MKQENVFENMKLNKSEIVKRRVGEIRLFVVYKVVSQIHRTRLISVFKRAMVRGQVMDKNRLIQQKNKSYPTIILHNYYLIQYNDYIKNITGGGYADEDTIEET